MAEKMEAVERGESKNLIFNVPPRHGKTQLCTKFFAAWYSGRNPSKDIIIATYNEKFAMEFGKELREILLSRRFMQIFPDYGLVPAAKSAEHMMVVGGGNIYCLGKGSATTGRGADIIIVDDPTKDDKDVKYDTMRDDAWTWFTKVLITRRHTDKARIVISQTRWHEDDIVGRITDESNPCYSEAFHKSFEVISIPAEAEENDPLGRRPGEPLWPERFGKAFLEEVRGTDPAAYSALYQCNPTPEEGSFYLATDIREYQRSELPDGLRWYVASDHAVSSKQGADRTCIVPFGVDGDGNAWIAPRIVWASMDTQRAVEEMIQIIRTFSPLFWYAEHGQITKAIGPYLNTRMRETGAYCPLVLDRPVGDKVQRAQSARARCAQGKIRFPAFSSWWPRARMELLKFPNARHDDFVDCISMIGLRLDALQGTRLKKQKGGPKRGTWAWQKREWSLDSGPKERIWT